ncbi:MAG: peptidase T [Ignavibacteria bacterium]|nr:peptidase T [Ignavibacteria bacterium]MDH7527956.1 peptidase T [Ignavibacteria bacterium]
MAANKDYTVVERFLRYVKYDTQSSEESTTFPSTEKQKILGQILADELKEIGMQNVELDEFGYVYAELPSNSDKDVPPIGFLAHMDTSPEVSGANVNPIIHKNYDGGKIVLPADPTQVIDPEEHPDLKEQIGNDIITADGTTLLGADNKAGLAEIVDAMRYLIQHPEIKHGPIKVCFTPDEEVGRGTEKIRLDRFGAKYAYTVDGESLGEIENETFCADTVILTIQGFNCHPGYAKNKLVNAIKIAADFIDALPKDSLSPETTEGREGYVHPYVVNGGVDVTTIKILIRDFEEAGLKEKEAFLKALAEEIVSKYPKASFKFEVQESYRNMRYVLDKHPQVVQYALEAVERAGIKPKLNIIRGGTDGSRLSYMGLPCPNIFAGEHAFHSRLEWISVQDMQKAVDVIVNLCQIWEEKS